MKAKKYTPILGGKYEVIGVKPGPIGTFLGTVDLSKINEETAERLVKAKSSYIRRARPKKQDDEKADGGQRNNDKD